LVLHAARIAEDGELLEPDGGEELNIRAIAEETIRLRGLYPDEHVIIREVENERWDVPVSNGPRTPKDPEREIYALARPTSTAKTIETALARCAAHIGEHDGDLDSNFWAAALRSILHKEEGEPSPSV
jgi:hypothetical protein